MKLVPLNSHNDEEIRILSNSVEDFTSVCQFHYLQQLPSYEAHFCGPYLRIHVTSICNLRFHVRYQNILVYVHHFNYSLLCNSVLLLSKEINK